MCTYRFIIPLWLSASLDCCFFLKLHLESVSDHKLRRSFLYIYIKLGVRNSKCLRLFPRCCRSTTVHVVIFTFIERTSLNLSCILCVVCLSFVFRIVPNDTNPVVVSIPPFFQPHLAIELVGVLAPKHSTLWWVFLVVFTEKGHWWSSITSTKCLTHLSSNTHTRTHPKHVNHVHSSKGKKRWSGPKQEFFHG